MAAAHLRRSYGLVPAALIILRSLVVVCAFRQPSLPITSSTRGARQAVRRHAGAANMLLGLFQKPTAATTKAGPSRQELKRKVLEQIEGSDMGRITTNRKDTTALLDQLATLNPTPNSATSPLAEGRWDLVWTTEDEIHLFRKQGLLGLTCLDVFQETDQKNLKLENVINFESDSFLRITSDLKPQKDGTRVYFSWTKPRVCYRGFTLPLPSFVQNAYYDNIYLDNEVRVVKDIRGNYLIVRRSE